MLLIFLLACQPKLNEEVVVSGEVYAGRAEGSAPLGGAALRTHNLYTEEVDRTEADAQGRFEILAPPIDQFFFTIEAEGFVPTSLSAAVGTTDTTAPTGAVWARSLADHEAALAPFAACPGADAPGGVIEGEVRVYLGDTVQGADELPLVTTASLFAEDTNGRIAAPCLLDDEGLYDPEAMVTGQTGRFAMFGLSPGIAALRLSYTIDDVPVPEQYTKVMVPEGGVAPLYPAWAELP